MAKLSDPASAAPLRMMLVGDSGTGKTGALCSLAKAGYNLHVADFDNGYEIIRNILQKEDPQALARVDVEVFRDKHVALGSTTVPKDSKAWAAGLTYLQRVFDSKLTQNDIVVIDSLSFAARTAMNFILKLNGRLAAQPYQSDWGEAQRLVENFVAMLADASLGCHILCTAHIAQSGGKKVETVGKGAQAERIVVDDGPVKRLPSMIGKAFNPIVPRYFNHMLLCTRVGSGNSIRRVIHTRPYDDLELKNTSPNQVKPEYPLASGLADYFFDVRGLKPGENHVR